MPALRKAFTIFMKNSILRAYGRHAEFDLNQVRLGQWVASAARHVENRPCLSRSGD
jgi:hypothetical protein